MQRFFDILFSGLALLFLAVPLLIVMVCLKFSGEGEVFYIQERIGRKGKTFGVYKFATMLKNSAAIGTGTVTVKNDPSIIGPRPQTKRCFDAFPEALHDIILQVRPGLSGIGSIIFRNEEEMMDSGDNADEIYNNDIMPYKGELEAWYVKHNSIFVFFALIFLTVWVVLTGKAGIVYKMFPSLPAAPRTLRAAIYGDGD